MDSIADAMCARGHSSLNKCSVKGHHLACAHEMYREIVLTGHAGGTWQQYVPVPEASLVSQAQAHTFHIACLSAMVAPPVAYLQMHSAKC